MIFEIQTRRKSQQETFIVIDDLADSFDYRNKYAIVQYLKDISDDGLFKLLIMTHNFDFFRTIESRFVGYSRCLMATKNGAGIAISQATGIRNIFANDWKPHFFVDQKKKIASIPFLRNLVEMTTGENDPNYQELTSMLHWKPSSPTITVGELDDIYNAICSTNENSVHPNKLIQDLLWEEANACLAANANANLENKIVLSIAIRMAAEKFMIDKINDAPFCAAITANQTHVLTEEYKTRFPGETMNIAILDRVALMTPENIHLNSFMYEPIIDMSDEHLRKLYREVEALN